MRSFAVIALLSLCAADDCLLKEKQYGWCNISKCCWENMLLGNSYALIWQQLADRGKPNDKMNVSREALLAQIAHAEPVSQQLGGYPDLNSKPISVEVFEGRPLQIALSLNVLRISSLDQKKQTFEINYMLKWYWRDCRIMTYCNDGYPIIVGMANRFFNSFWTPPYRLEEMEDDSEHMRKGRHFLSWYGMHQFSEERVSVIRCSFDFHDLPFDEQTCKLSFWLPDAHPGEYELEWAEILSDPLATGGWQITQGKDFTKRNEVKKVEVMSWTHEVPMLVAEFKFTRNPVDMQINVTLPVVIIYIVSWLGLWVDVAAVPARVFAAFLPVMILTAKINSLSASLPMLSYTSRMTNFCIMTLVFLLLHVADFGAVHYSVRRAKHYADLSKQPEATEAWSERKLAFFACMEHKVVKCASMHFEQHVRWVSVLAYGLASIVVMHV